MWIAHEFYDEGRLGKASMYGLKTREEAIAWLSGCFNWKRCWFMKPSQWIEERKEQK